MARPRVVIVGGGFGGLNAAKALRHADVDVVVLDRKNHHVFQPLLYQVAAAALSPSDIASPIRWILRRQANVRVWLAEVTGVDPARRVVALANEPHELAYDYLIVAAGVTHAYFGHDQWSRHAPGLKTLEDALEIRARVLKAFELAEVEDDPGEQRRLLTFVVVLLEAGPVVLLLRAVVEPLRASALAAAPQIGLSAARFDDLPRGLRYLLPLSSHRSR